MASKHTHSDYFMFTIYYNGFPGGSDSKESACQGHPAHLTISRVDRLISRVDRSGWLPSLTR